MPFCCNAVNNNHGGGSETSSTSKRFVLSVVTACGLPAAAATALVMLIVVLSGRQTLAGLDVGARGGPQPFAPPDYHEASSWDALPTVQDGADVVPAACGSDRQASAPVDVFYIHPTSFFAREPPLGPWNQPRGDAQANLLVGLGQLTQQASAFNEVGRIFAPRYRQVSQTGQQLDDRWNCCQHVSQSKTRSAANGNGNSSTGDDRDVSPLEMPMEVAFSDVRRAFDHFLKHYNAGRPFIMAAHSQGTMHAKRLLIFASIHRPEVLQRLVVAYLPGNTIAPGELPLPICGHATQTVCFVSWNTLIHGADPTHWLAKLPPGQHAMACVNPLSWRNNTERSPRAAAQGSMPVTGHLLLTAMDVALVGAACSKEGALLVDNPAAKGGWGYIPDITFPAGGELHAYDYPLFYSNIRSNARQRVDAYMQANFPTWAPHLQQNSNHCRCRVVCSFDLLKQVAALCTCFWLLLALLSAPFRLSIWMIRHRHHRGGCPSAEAVCINAFMCCCCTDMRCCTRVSDDAPRISNPVFSMASE